MKALIVGLGGIGESVYLPELKKLNYEIHTVDLNSLTNPTFTNILEVNDDYDVSIICVPNCSHKYCAEELIGKSKVIFVEKPGFANMSEWIEMTYHNTDTKIILVKNNLYRNDYGVIFNRIQDIEQVDFNWINRNRIPNPGSWSTSNYMAFSGVAHDLMSHLLCFAYKMFGNELLSNNDVTINQYQQWKLSTIGTTDYGTVNNMGAYDVCDYATAYINHKNIPLRFTVSWKQGYDDQSVIVYYKDGTHKKWNFGLCPSYAYGKMIADVHKQSYDWHKELDIYIHDILENYIES